MKRIWGARLVGIRGLLLLAMAALLKYLFFDDCTRHEITVLTHPPHLRRRRRGLPCTLGQGGEGPAEGRL